MNPFRTLPRHAEPQPTPRPYLFRQRIDARFTELVVGLVCFAALVVLTR